VRPVLIVLAVLLVVALAVGFIQLKEVQQGEAKIKIVDQARREVRGSS